MFYGRICNRHFSVDNHYNVRQQEKIRRKRGDRTRRLIDANSLKHNMDKFNYSYFGANYEKILEVIDEEPTVDTVKHAHWTIKKYGLMSWWKCSNCNSQERVISRYCPECGAKMDEVTE